MTAVFIRKTSAFIIVMFLAAFPGMPSPLFAAGLSNEQWKYLGAGDKGHQFYYDAASIINLSHDLIQVWTRELAPNTAPTRRLKEINCSFKIIRDQQVIEEKTDTKSQRIQNKPSAWHAMEKDPILNKMYQTLCR